jgi:hypothetical protein
MAGPAPLKAGTRSRYGRYVAVAAFALVAAGPIYQLIAFARDTGTFQWMQTAYDEPFYINDAMEPLGFGERTLSQLPIHLMQALGIASFDAIAILSGLIFPLLAFWAAWILAGNLTREAAERACWALALIFGFELFSLNSNIIFSPSLAERLEKMIGIPWLFAADPFPYFNLYRTPEPQTTWVVLFLYLALLVRFAITLELRWYRIACLVTPLFAICYITVAVNVWMLFVILSMYSIALLRLSIKLMFAVALAITVGLLFFAFRHQNGQAVAITVFDSRLPILKTSIAIASIGLVWLLLLLRQNQWRLNARFVLAGGCALIPIIDLNQQLLTGKVVIAQQWELYCNYSFLVLAFGLLATWSSSLQAHRGGARRMVAGVVLFAIAAIVVAGHRYTYWAFLDTNLLSVIEARAYHQIVDRRGRPSAVVLTHFWDESLFRIRVPDAAPVIGGATWMMQHPLPPVDRFRSPDEYLAHNAQNIAVGFDALSRQEYDAETLRKALHYELGHGLCWPTTGYFFGYRDCWSRLSNYAVNASQNLQPWIDIIVRRYAEFLQRTPAANDTSPVLVMRRTPLDTKTGTGLWRYEPLGEFSLSAGGATSTVYAYWQTPRGGELMSQPSDPEKQ